MKRSDSRSKRTLEELRNLPGRLPVSVIITTYNEESNIVDCVESALWADEVFLVDSFSTDKTMELARQYPITIRQREYYGSAAQKNWSLDRVTNDWVLILDADERVPEELAKEVLQILASKPTYKGYFIRRENLMGGKIIRHSGWSTDRVIRLFHRAHGRYPNRRVHADVDIEGPVPVLRNALVHHTFRSFEQYLEKSVNYAQWGAAQGFREGRRAGLVEIGLRPLWRFFRTYILQLGFVEGVHGLVVCGLQACGVFLKYAWLWDHRNRHRMGERIELPLFDEASSTWKREEAEESLRTGDGQRRGQS